MGVGNYTTLWVGWPGIYVKPGRDRDALAAMLMKEGYVPVWLEPQLLVRGTGEGREGEELVWFWIGLVLVGGRAARVEWRLGQEGKSRNITTSTTQ